MQIWTKNKAGHWKKRRTKALEDITHIGLHGYLLQRQAAKISFNTTWIVFDNVELENELLVMGIKMFGCEPDSLDSTIKLLAMIIADLKNMSVVRVSNLKVPGPFQLAIRIQ